ncbi:MAG: NADH-quinone oxidoreductase subunit NuoE [Candidatus Eisenbacteria bacterium]|uniref:NADH-quinone oxidoreductase subunit NuoE n=1 Tax=Eiseniibacteriota bacterium TaxID=2212470 RepID=A0A956M0T2_UNCEI|nr:NADH-quinone oxidoreductase subunit NuoE [Candidatus Eisenbacteria bacterium]
MQPFVKPTEDITTRQACQVESLGHPVQFSAENQKTFQHLLTRYPTKQAAVLPTLWLAQEEFGWISTEVIEYVSELLDLPPSHVYGVVSFYTMFYRKPMGKYHVQLCTNVSCMLMGGGTILDCLREKLGIDLNETTADGLFSLSEVECLAACEMAPMAQVNDEFHGPLTPEGVNQLVESLKKRG